MSKVKYFITETPKWPFGIKVTDSFGDEVYTFAKAEAFPLRRTASVLSACND